MCTLTYLPLTNGFTLYHTRDEVPERNSPIFPIVEDLAEKTLYRPLDSVSQGSWIVTSTDGVTGCLLNGAFEKHTRKPPYRHSRGKILLDLMHASNREKHLQKADFINIEPFTVVLFFSGKILEMRWDGEKKFFKEVDHTLPQIWSSATLYPKDKIKLREQWFAQWLKEKGKQPEALESFHHHGGAGDPEYDIRMKRPGGPCSVSITSLTHKKGSKAIFCFEDLIGETKNCVEITYAA